MGALVTIGEFSRQCGISVSALRFYDRCGLLVPAEVDPSTGYRTYDLAQLGDAAVLRDLRLIGLSIDEVRIFNTASDIEQQEMITARLAVLERELRHAQVVAVDLRHRLTNKEDPMPTLRIDAATFAHALTQVVPAVGTDPEHPRLHNVLIEVRESTFRLVATDGYRMAVRDIAVGVGEAEFRALVAGDQLAAVQPSLPTEGNLTISVAEDHLVVRAGDQSWKLALSDDEFPRYEHLLTASPDAAEATLNRAQLREALESRLDVEVVRLDLTAQRLTIAVAGTREQNLTIDYPGDPIRFGLNPRYALDAAQYSVGPDLVLDITGPDRPMVFRSADDGSYIYMLMPITLTDAHAA